LFSISYAKLNNIAFANISLGTGFMGRVYHNFAGTPCGHPSSLSIQP